MMLRNPAVDRELKITDEQRRNLQSLFEDITSRERNDRSGSSHKWPDMRSQEMLREMKAHETGIARILTQAQLGRLTQIALQTRGLHAFQEPEVIAALDLTKDQREQLNELARHLPAPRADDHGPPPKHDWDGPPPDEGEGPPRRGGPRPEKEHDMHEALALLTPAQREKWNELTGPPFDMGRQGPRGRRPDPWER